MGTCVIHFNVLFNKTFGGGGSSSRALLTLSGSWDSVGEVVAIGGAGSALGVHHSLASAGGSKVGRVLIYLPLQVELL